jgi:hypothetical protein
VGERHYLVEREIGIKKDLSSTREATFEVFEHAVALKPFQLKPLFQEILLRQHHKAVEHRRHLKKSLF